MIEGLLHPHSPIRPAHPPKAWAILAQVPWRAIMSRSAEKLSMASPMRMPICPWRSGVNVAARPMADAPAARHASPSTTAPKASAGAGNGEALLNARYGLVKRLRLSCLHSTACQEDAGHHWNNLEETAHRDPFPKTVARGRRATAKEVVPNQCRHYVHNSRTRYYTGTR
jgi:hypothetical protein